MLAISIIYACFVFWHLGDRQMPQTIWHPKQYDSVVMYSERSIGTLYYHCGLIPDDDHYRGLIGVNLKVESSEDGVVWHDCGTVDRVSVFQWLSYSLRTPGNYVKLTALDDSTVISELGAGSAYFKSMTDFTVEGSDVLNDEHEMVPDYISYENSGYFDEVYHPRTAYEHLLGLEPYENTHPPVGKYIIGLGILLFGLNPFGWRFMGTLFGVLMLPIFYHLIKKLFGRTWLSTFGTVLFALDFMHYTQTRLATIDTYAVFFILLMYDAMICFMQKDIVQDKMRYILLPLGLSGMFFGIGAASKWTVIYGGVGLAVLYFIKLGTTIYRNRKDRVLFKASWKRSFALCLWCLLLFIVIPVAIYFIAYLPMTTLPHNRDKGIWAFWNYQTNMFDYHSQLKGTHPYESPWYEWPIIKRPIWYSYNTVEGGLISDIACLGNPLIWWFGLGMMALLILFWLRKRDLKAGVALCGYASVYVPWMLVPRMTFIYHYFTAVPFLILAIVCMFDKMAYGARLNRKFRMSGHVIPLVSIMSVTYVLACLVLFIVFFPIMSGMPVESSYLDGLKWFSTWSW